MSTTSPVYRIDWRPAERESDRRVEWYLSRDTAVVGGFEHPPVPAGSMLLSDFLSDFLAQDDIAEQVPAAEAGLADSIRKVRGGDTLKSLRLGMGMSQGDLARAIETSQSRMSRLESRIEKPSEDCLRKLGSALQVDFNTLMNALANGD